MTVSPSIVSPRDAVERIDDVTLVDVRPERDFVDVGHLPGAVNVPFEQFRDPSNVDAGTLPGADAFAALLATVGVDPDDSLVAYDDGSGTYAARFLLTAIVYGHRDSVSLLDGGYDAWRREYDVETGAVDPDQTRPVSDPGVAVNAPLVDRAGVKAAASGDAVLVDTRTPAEYGEAHIPGAVQLGLTALTENGRVKPDAELESILADKGITHDRRVVLYCNTARRLSYTYVVLAALGYENVGFYEGSLTDWVRAEAPTWDPQQLYEDLRAVAPDGFDALPRELGDDVFGRLHLVGLYTQKQPGYFMLRTKVPGGRLTAEQARTVGEIADEFARAPPEHGGREQNPAFGDGFLDVTTRQGLQLHWIRAEDVPEIWDRYADVGLTTIQASGNTLRNVVTCPAAGLVDDDVAVQGFRDDEVQGFGDDTTVQRLVDDIVDAFTGDRRYANLPRKLKVSLTGCRENCGRAEIQDVGFMPARKNDRIGFNVIAGGGLSDGPRVASDLDAFVEPADVVDVVLAVADVFIEHGRYLDTAVNRLKFIVEDWGVERFRAELERHLEDPLEHAGESLTDGYRGDHVGVHRQADGRYYVGLNVPTGRVRGVDFIELADLADRYGSGELRVTPNQNVVVPDVPADALDAFLEADVLSQYTPDPGPFTRGVVTCTGSEFCSYGVVETKTRGLRWARELDDWAAENGHVAALPDAVRLHFSGCSASCAQPQIGDVGLRGERYRDDHTAGPAADVGFGGDLDAGEFIDWVAGSVPLEDVPSGIKWTVRRYLEEAHPDESFAAWSARTSNRTLRGLIESNEGPRRIEQGVQ